MTQKLGSALNGATSGFAATQGAMALFGDENQALEESLLKVQSALAIQQGVQGLTEAYRELSIGSKLAAAGQAAFTFVTGGATTGLKLFRAALISTGVGALVVGLGLLIANFDKVKEVLTDVNKGFKEGGLLTKALMIAFAPLIATVKLVQKGLQAIGVLESDQEKARKVAAAKQIERSLAEQRASIQRLKDIDKEIEAIDRQSEAERRLTGVKLRQIALDQAKAKSTQEVVDLEKEATEAKIALNQKEYDDFIEKQKKTLEKHEEEARILQSVIDRNIAAGRSDHQNEIKLLDKRKAHIAKLNNDILNNNFDFYTENQVAREEIEAEGQRKVDSIRKTAHDKWKAYAQDRLSIARKIEDIQNSLLTDGIEKELEINRDKFRRLREDAKKNTKLTRKERARLIELFDEQELAQQKVIDAKYEKIRQDKIDKEKAELQELVDFNEELRLKEIEDNKAKNLQIIEDNKAAAAKQKEIDEKAKADAQAIQDFKFDIASQGLQTISNLTELFAGKSEKAAKKAFQVQKAVSIAQATIDTYKSANAIFASTAANPITVLNPSAPFIAAGVAVAAGLVNVASIASQKFQGGGSTGGGGQESAPDLGGGATPQFNVVGDSGINQIAQLQQQPVQAFVVSGEVTTSQALDRNRVQNATL